MKAEETTLITWECPECTATNTIFLIENELLPKELQCSFCNHKSGLIDWKF